MSDILVITYENPFYAPPRTRALNYFYPDNPPTSTVGPETNTHFVGKFAPVKFGHVRGLYQGDALDVVSAPSFETNQHFVGKHQPAAYKYLPLQRQNIAADFSTPGFETNTHFVGKFKPVAYRAPGAFGLYQGLATDVVSAASFETNTNFVGKFAPAVYKAALGLYQSAPPEITAGPPPDDPSYVVGKFQPATYAYLLSQRQNIAADFSTPGFETNQNFVGKFAPVTFKLALGLYQGLATDVPAVIAPETNTHFLGKFTPATLKVALGLYQGIATDVVSAASFETNVHFVGKFAPVTYKGIYQGLATDLQVTVQPETNVHFVGKHQPTNLISLQLYRSNIAADFTAPAPAEEVIPSGDGPPWHLTREELRRLKEMRAEFEEIYGREAQKHRTEQEQLFAEVRRAVYGEPDEPEAPAPLQRAAELIETAPRRPSRDLFATDMAELRRIIDDWNEEEDIEILLLH